MKTKLQLRLSIICEPVYFVNIHLLLISSLYNLFHCKDINDHRTIKIPLKVDGTWRQIMKHTSRCATEIYIHALDLDISMQQRCYEATANVLIFAISIGCKHLCLCIFWGCDYFVLENPFGKINFLSPHFICGVFFSTS